MSFNPQSILLTGASGQLGRAICRSGKFKNILTPTRIELDLTQANSIRKYFETHDFDVLLHAAALARVVRCQQEPSKAIEVNLMGTCNLVLNVLEKEKRTKRSIRFIYISTDGVYASTRGHYSEEDATIPYSVYGWTKLGAECAVHGLTNFSIIRTRFFDSQNIKYNRYASDSYTSSLPIEELVNSIDRLLNSDFVGTINIGAERKSDYERFKVHKLSIQPCTIEALLKEAVLPLSRDASLDCRLWERVMKSRKQ
ncbi:MAG: sugar nucleotide-binding protein [Planctomycetes bacterium]|nr:sugar nucleotide-binding protein [Planctomycetota bacterium]